MKHVTLVSRPEPAVLGTGLSPLQQIIIILTKGRVRI